MFVGLSETFMEPYFERYETPGTKDPPKANPLKQIFNNKV
jgi:hypothetical protein